jgi:class 3 adenylate cyclase/tetratricopeptide (TPR) repeat protein
VIVCPSCGKENPEEARFCLACGSPVAEAHDPPAPAGPSEERKLVTALFVDVVGSTARAEQLDPEDVKAMLAPYHARAGAELERFGGRVEKFVGDAVLALFGAPVAYEDDPERAVRAALAIKGGVAELNASDAWLDLHIRIGIHTGEALVMLEARPDQGEWAAAGDVMNTAARLQSSAPTDGILVGEETYKATRGVIEYRDHEAIEAKGKAEPVQVWEAVALRGLGEEDVSPDLPLVGRADESRLLAELWDEVRIERRPMTVLLIGAPGVGKSRLLSEFARGPGTQGVVLSGRCLPYGEGITYWALGEMIRQAAGVLQSDELPTATAKLGAFLDSLPTSDLDELRTMAAALAALIGAPTTPRGTYAAEEISQAELHWGLRRLFELMATSAPLVLLFEDLHWADPTLLELIHFIATGSVGVPILLLGSARPEFEEAELGAAWRTIELGTLSVAESEELVELLGSAHLPPERLADMLEHAGGNPLFLEELVAMLLETGAETPEQPVPRSLQALIGARLDTLAKTEKRTAQHASICGQAFWPGAVGHLVENADDLTPSLEVLERRDFIRAQDSSSIGGEREYAFKNILIRDVAYGRLPKGRRVALHVRFADWLEALVVEDELVEIVAYHLEQACRLAGEVSRSPIEPPVARAAESLIRAAAKAERREGMREAERFYSRALELVDQLDPETVVEVRLGRAGALCALGDLRLATAELDGVAVEAERLRRPDLRCAALVQLGNVEQKRGRVSDARRHLLEAEALAESIADPRLQIRAGFELAELQADFDAEFAKASERLLHALRIAESIGDRALRIDAHLRLGFVFFNGGDLKSSEEQFLRCSNLAGETGSHRDEARATFHLGLVKYYRGELEAAESLGLRALEWLERTGDSYFQIQNLRGLALYALARDDVTTAEQRLREALVLALEGGGWLVIELYRLLAEVIVRQENLDEARELVAFAARNLPEEDIYARAALLLSEASVAAAGGEQAAAATAYAEALRLLEEQQLTIDLAEARISLARALRGFGDVLGARTEFERARTAFARMGASGLVEVIDRELEEPEGARHAGSLRESD